MARIRTIKPEFPQSASMGRVSRDARLLFMLVWTLADDAGRLRGESRMLASLLYPYDDGEDGNVRTSRADIDRWLSELESEDCVTRYECGGDQYLEIRNWLKHQKIDKPSKSKIPGPDDAESRSLANVRELSSGDQGSEDQRIEGKDQGSEDHSVADATTDVPRRTSEKAGEITRIFGHWQTEFGMPRAKLDGKRRKLIADRLKDYSEADLCQSLSGYRNSPFHMGKNDRNTVYVGIELLLKDAKHVDEGLSFYANPPRTDLSDKTRRIIDQTEGWVPPEMRHAAN